MTITPEEWDEFRSDPLVKRVMDFIVSTTNEQWGGDADSIARNQYQALLTDPRQQIYYARLRGHVECANELKDMLNRPLEDLIDTDEGKNELEKD